MDEQPILVLVTTPSVEIGRQIALALLEQRVAACVNILGPLTSLYHWQGSLQDEQEYLLVIKSFAGLFTERMAPAIQALHPYQVPEIIALPIQDGLPAYLAWMGETVQER